LATVGLTGGTSLTVDGQFDIDVAELRADWKATLPAILGTII
jgi:phosphoribosylformylglycinamidine synthase